MHISIAVEIMILFLGDNICKMTTEAKHGHCSFCDWQSLAQLLVNCKSAFMLFCLIIIVDSSNELDYLDYGDSTVRKALVGNFFTERIPLEAFKCQLSKVQVFYC